MMPRKYDAPELVRAAPRELEGRARADLLTALLIEMQDLHLLARARDAIIDEMQEMVICGLDDPEGDA